MQRSFRRTWRKFTTGLVDRGCGLPGVSSPRHHGRVEAAHQVSERRRPCCRRPARAAANARRMWDAKTHVMTNSQVRSAPNSLGQTDKVFRLASCRDSSSISPTRAEAARAREAGVRVQTGDTHWSSSAWQPRPTSMGGRATVVPGQAMAYLRAWAEDSPDDKVHKACRLT